MAKQYIEPKKRYEDHRSTGFLFLGFGIAGALATLLCWIGIIKLPLNGFQLGIMLAMFAAFIGFGIWSFQKASKIAKTLPSESIETEEIRAWTNAHCDSFCSAAKEELSESELYFQREQEIREAILGQFPKIDEGLLELPVEETYQKLFES